MSQHALAEMDRLVAGAGGGGPRALPKAKAKGSGNPLSESEPEEPDTAPAPRTDVGDPVTQAISKLTQVVEALSLDRVRKASAATLPLGKF